ncbi:MAG: hypothetical protein RLY86_1044 [Pseudomonadota bacterium]|jgi:hypothetical protein
MQGIWTRSATLAAAGILAVGLSVTTPALAGDQDFELINRTGYTIAEVYVSPSKASTWEEDIMGRDMLPHGNSVHIQFSRKEDVCIWDLMVVYDDGESAEWSQFDLCTISRIAISYERKTGNTWAEWE